MSDQDEGMDKYGVDETGKGLNKEAAKNCPECGAALEKHGSVVVCPKHGTEPFEGK